MSGFPIIYVQFYELYQNYYFDWCNTSAIVQMLHLPVSVTAKSSFGLIIGYEWIYFINSILIIIGVVYFSILFSKLQTLKAYSLGMVIASLGLLAAGFFTEGSSVLFGIIVYTIGEMIVNPRFTEFFSSLGSTEKKSQYMGYLSLTQAIGLSCGSLFGGWIYQHFGEKASLSLKYLNDHFSGSEVYFVNTAFVTLSEKLHLNEADLTIFLKSFYKPEMIWVAIAAIGVISAILILLIDKKKSR